MDKEYIKKNSLKGIRLGLVSFLITFGFALVISLIINFVFLNKFNMVINGSLSENPKLTGSSIVVIISFIMNMSVFNSGSSLQNGGTLHIGLLIFALIPIISFLIADRRDNKEKSFDLHDMMIYLVSSLSYALFVYLYSLIAKGYFLGIEFDFSAIRNLGMTFIIVVCIQFFIGLNYNKTFSPGLKMSRLLLRVFLGIGLVFGTIGMLILFTRYVSNIFLVLFVIILLLPNVAVYLMFTFMGASIEFGDQIQTLLALVDIDLSFATIGLPIRIGLIVFFFTLVFAALWRLNEEKYLRELSLFAISFSFISVVLAYCTKMNLGFVKNLVDVQFGINYLIAFFVPFIVISLAGILVLLVRYIHKEFIS